MDTDRLKLLIQHRLDETGLTKAPVFCDIDDTIIKWNLAHTSYKPNQQVIDALKLMYATGTIELVLWSGAGAQHCRDIAEEFGLTNMVSAYLTKPAVCIDDFKFERFTTLIHPDNI
jgi:predicted HAD superfamily phosphohydrolase YqeG